ncbi:MAG TPA: GGDEF domain-containing protein [Thermoanaerobaculia bacterium]|nr:GGDEF domain-containing protein [Thermoanaerobaculia bacterium]
MLPVPAEIGLALVALAAAVAALVLRARVKELVSRLAAREQRGHFLGESPDLRGILKHAFAATAEVLPVSRFDLYRVGGDGRIEEVWSVSRPSGAGEPEPVLEAASPHIGETIDAARLREISATETERSFAPRDLLSGGPPSRRLRLPLYSGDRLIAHLDLTSPDPVDDSRKEEIRSLLGPFTASLHAFRNWTIAVTDELSGLSSRRYFETRLAEEWSRRERYGGALSVASFDLDHFKKLNDTLGHQAGDAAIRRFGEVIRQAIRTSDIACRYGGEEFAILFPETTAPAARGVSMRIRAAIENERLEFAGRPFKVTVSGGVAEAESAMDREQLLFHADQALYAAKKAGRNQVQPWTRDLQTAALAPEL